VLRKVALFCALAGLAALLVCTAPAISAPAKTMPKAVPSALPNPRPKAAPGQLPACPAGGGASTKPPTSRAGISTRGACRAAGRVLESGVRLARPGEAAFTPSGYHHLGANTGGEWSGVSGRISVVNGTVRPNTYDFVAARFMVKRNMGRGNIAWLEAGWAETGWATPGRQHIYTFNTNTKTWQFYDQYLLRPGARVWLDVHSDNDGVWAAWLWWNNRWNLLTAQKLPIGNTAVVEQYVEVHVDAGKPGRLDVPAVTVDNVQLRPPGGGASRYWRADVPTLTGADSVRQQRRGGFCLDWVNRYDTWKAGDCDDGALIHPAPPRDPLPSGDAEVVPPSASPSPAATPTPSESPEPAEVSEPAATPTNTTRSLLGGLLG
jgi:hypothetical protein